MVESFNITKLPSVIFGKGSLNQLPNLINQSVKTIVLITGNKTTDRSPILKNIIDKLISNQITINHHLIITEPSPNAINEIVFSETSENSIVIAIGGGSCIDAGKAISAMIPLQQDITEYLEVVGSKIHPGVKLPFIAIPTTSGTGSEASANAVISKVGVNGFKRSLRHVNFVPDQVILDPELTLNCPSNITAASGMDAITQLIEAYVSTKSSIYINSLIEKAIFKIDQFLLQVVLEAPNIEARSAMMYAAYISGVALANSGLGLVHGFASELGAITNIPHGVICAQLAYPCHKINVDKALILNDTYTIDKYARLYDCISGEQIKLNLQEKAIQFIDRINRLKLRLQIPSLSEYGITKDQLNSIAQNSGIKNNPVDITKVEKLQILNECL